MAPRASQAEPMVRFPATTLWLGHAGHARDAKALFDAGIEAVVDLAAEEQAAVSPRQLIYCRFPLNDGAGNNSAMMVLATDTVCGLLERELQTLLACSAGLSRSPTIAAFALAKKTNTDPKLIVEQLRSLKPVDINPVFWSEVESAISSSR